MEKRKRGKIRVKKDKMKKTVMKRVRGSGKKKKWKHDTGEEQGTRKKRKLL